VGLYLRTVPEKTKRFLTSFSVPKRLEEAMSKLSIEVELTPDQILKALRSLTEAEKETVLLELNRDLGQEILDAKARVERGETSSFEEVFGHPQPKT
jgi:hypothetical protein